MCVQQSCELNLLKPKFPVKSTKFNFFMRIVLLEQRTLDFPQYDACDANFELTMTTTNTNFNRGFWLTKTATIQKQSPLPPDTPKSLQSWIHKHSRIIPITFVRFWMNSHALECWPKQSISYSGCFSVDPIPNVSFGTYCFFQYSFWGKVWSSWLMNGDGKSIVHCILLLFEIHAKFKLKNTGKLSIVKGLWF